jgi:hypothetical protein
LCSTPFGTTNDIARAQHDRGLPPGAVPQSDVELPVEDQEELVGVVVHVPHVLSEVWAIRTS